MDTTKTVTHVSLCAGYGGIDLGLKRAVPGLRTIAFSEIEAYACANLVAKMEEGFLDPAPIWTNVKTFPWGDFCGKVDILSGGYPCQPFSAAGKRLGKDDPRHLWPFIADGIRLMQPRLCFFENVEGHISLGLREVISELESIGYKATWGIFSASEVGAPHRRKRIFIMAYTMRYGSSESWNVCQRPDGQEFSGNGQQRGIDARVSDTMCEGLPGQREVPSRIESKLRDISHNSWWASERGLGRMAHGDSYWVDRLRLCGNGVVPATATLAFQTLLKRL